MKELEMPKAELIRFDNEDIVRTSEEPCNFEQ